MKQLQNRNKQSKVHKIPKVHKTWKINPATKPHSSEKGKRGYNRKNKNWNNDVSLD